MTDLAAGRLSPAPLRFVFPRNTAKRAARRFRRPLNTVVRWLAEGVPAAERERYAAIIDAELDAIEREIRRIRSEG